MNGNQDKLNNPISRGESPFSEEFLRERFKNKLKGYRQKRKINLIKKYGNLIENALNNIEKKENLARFLKNSLGSYFERIEDTLNQYILGKLNKNELIYFGILELKKKFIDIFIHKSRDVFLKRKASVFLSLFMTFVFVFCFCLVYFIFIMPLDITTQPKGNFILPGNERDEWIFTMIMMPLTIILFGFVGTILLSHLTIRIYIKLVRKNQKLGLVPTEKVFGSALYRKLLNRAIIIGFLAFNFSYSLSSQKLLIEFMRSVYPEGINLIPDPELMIQIIWIVSIPCTLMLVPIWLMMDIGLVKTKKVSGVEFESVNLSGMKFYKFIKGYASIGFLYNLVLLTFIWASDDVPFMRAVMRAFSPILVICFMFPLVIYIEIKNEVFKKKLWRKLKKYKINKKLLYEIKIQEIQNHEEIFDF